MAFTRVASLSEVPRDRGLCVRVGDEEIGLYRIGDDVFAMHNSCPHQGYPLSEGELDGTQIVCPAHLWAFDVCTGLGPGEIDEEALPRYQVAIEGDDVLVDITIRML